MHTLEFHTPDSAPPAEPGEAQQYSLARILGIWVAATAPMGLLAWVVWPACATCSLGTRDSRSGCS
jgi:hypothetical protein